MSVSSAVGPAPRRRFRAPLPGEDAGPCTCNLLVMEVRGGGGMFETPVGVGGQGRRFQGLERCPVRSKPDAPRAPPRPPPSCATPALCARRSSAARCRPAARP
jgi:hypothetical protein